MPSRAEDAAIVPVTLRTKLSPGDSRQVLSITLVIDQNPAPMAAKFQLGPDARVSEISTRVRVNSYTDVHAVAELSDGKLYMIKTYVKASGGCSAPAAKNADEAESAGSARCATGSSQRPAKAPPAVREAQIMIGHPNNSGLQMDQITQLYVPAFFVNELRLWQDDSLVLTMEGGISISEDPNIRFTYVSNGAKTLPRRGEGHRRTRLPARMEGRRFRDLTSAACSAQKQRTSASACARLSSLSALAACSEVRNGAAHISPDLRHAEHRFGGDIALIGHERSDNIDRTGALLDRLPRLAIRLQATEYVFNARRRRIIVEVLGARDHCRRHQRHQRGDNTSYRSDQRHRLPPLLIVEAML